jgi:hypothetical protein
MGKQETSLKEANYVVLGRGFLDRCRYRWHIGVWWHSRRRCKYRQDLVLHFPGDIPNHAHYGIGEAGRFCGLEAEV